MFSRRLVNLRESKNLLQKDLADIFNVNRSTISSWENGTRTPGPELLIKIANYFEVSVDYLLGNDRIHLSELERIEILRNALVKKGFLDKNEIMTKKQYDKFLEFYHVNKQFLKDEDE